MNENREAEKLAQRLQMTERQVNVLRDKNRNLDKQLAGISGNNQRLVALLETTREQIINLKSALEKDGDTPSATAPSWPNTRVSTLNRGWALNPPAPSRWT